MFNLIREYGIIKILLAGMSEIYRKIWLEMICNSYSQYGEDRIIDSLLKYKKKITYIDLGGYHPTRLSNTYRFYKRGGNGVIVEPNPTARPLFSKLRPRDKYLAIGVGDEDGSLVYYQYLILALNTFSEQQVIINQKDGHKVTKMTEVKIVDVRKIQKEVGNIKIDLLSLDIEGWDRKILERWNWSMKPELICVENNVDDILVSQGYVARNKTAHNTIYQLRKATR